jgi:hypothetical protein
MDYAVDIRLALEFESCSYIRITRGKPSVLNKVFYEVQHFHLALSHFLPPSLNGHGFLGSWVYWQPYWHHKVV